MDLLSPSETRTLCAYKGQAHYWSVAVGGEVYENVAWSYPDPTPDNPQIRNLVCFLNEWADVYVDGERLERPATQWSGVFARTCEVVATAASKGRTGPNKRRSSGRGSHYNGRRERHDVARHMGKGYDQGGVSGEHPGVPGVLPAFDR